MNLLETELINNFCKTRTRNHTFMLYFSYTKLSNISFIYKYILVHPKRTEKLYACRGLWVTESNKKEASVWLAFVLHTRAILQFFFLYTHWCNWVIDDGSLNALEKTYTILLACRISRSQGCQPSGVLLNRHSPASCWWTSCHFLSSSRPLPPRVFGGVTMLLLRRRLDVETCDRKG